MEKESEACDLILIVVMVWFFWCSKIPINIQWTIRLLKKSKFDIRNNKKTRTWENNCIVITCRKTKRNLWSYNVTDRFLLLKQIWRCALFYESFPQWLLRKNHQKTKDIMKWALIMSHNMYMSQINELL